MSILEWLGFSKSDEREATSAATDTVRQIVDELDRHALRLRGTPALEKVEHDVLAADPRLQAAGEHDASRGRDGEEDVARRPAETERRRADADADEQEAARPFEARVDGDRVVISADKEIVLQCGKASITLTRAGKILLRGAYLLSRSSGVNRIKGGSVQIN